MFHTSYPEDVEITQLRNEHQQADGEVITDSCLLIGKKMYHIECQSTDDTTMAVRMIEYDFAIAIEKELTGSGRSELYTDLIKLIVKISDYIFQDEEKIQKGIGDAMGGKVLELESERLRAEGEARGKAIGESIGEARGKAIGEVRGEERLSVLINKLILDKRNDEIQIVVTDAKKRRQYYDEYGL